VAEYRFNFRSPKVNSRPLPSSLAPLPYHREVVRFLREREPELWKWAGSAQARMEYADAVRLQLLKETYRLESDAHPEVAAACARVMEHLGLNVPVTLYQSGGSEMNASLCYLANEAHVILTGPILNTLDGRELEAVLAHELAHYRLWEMEEGQFHTADRLLTAVANDSRATREQLETARRYRLYTEIYADRGSLLGCGEVDGAVAALVKVQTGLASVNPQSYLRQAEEIFAKAESKAEGVSHPEIFIRARALQLWSENSREEGWLAKIIEGPLSLDQLDLIGQTGAVDLTRDFLAQLLRPRWFQSELTLAHARQFFEDFQPAKSEDPQLPSSLPLHDGAGRDYFCSLLLDFAAVDPELEELPLAAGVVWSERLGIAEAFEKMVLKDLGLNKRQFGKIKKGAAGVIAKAEVAHG
jgi:hypothetical protein